MLVSAAFFNVAAVYPIEENMYSETSVGRKQTCLPGPALPPIRYLLGHVPYVGHLFISAIQPSTQLVRGATIKPRKSQKSVEWSSKVMGKNPALTQVYAQSFLEPLRLSNRN